MKIASEIPRLLEKTWNKEARSSTGSCFDKLMLRQAQHERVVQ